jgi:hypothetical protein
LQIPRSELDAFYAREMEFRWLHVPVYTPDGKTLDVACRGAAASSPANEKSSAAPNPPTQTHAHAHTGIMCAAYSDDEYRKERLGGSSERYAQTDFGRLGIAKIWRDDLLPCRVYTRHCVLAATALSKRKGETEPASAAYAQVLDNFLDTTFLGDRVTTLRAHLHANPAILTELPPPALAQRYSG